jgi:hypothetical protein
VRRFQQDLIAGPGTRAGDVAGDRYAVFKDSLIFGKACRHRPPGKRQLMTMRKFLIFGVVVLFAAGACSDPVVPPFPEPPEDKKDDGNEDTTGFRVTIAPPVVWA